MNKFYFVAYEFGNGEKIIRAFNLKEKLTDELKWLNEEATDIKEYSYSAKPMCLDDFLSTLL